MVPWRDGTRADDAQPAMHAETLSIAAAPRDMATPARVWPASACRRIAMAIGPGGIAKTNPSPRPTSQAVTMALPLSPRASPISLDAHIGFRGLRLQQCPRSVTHFEGY